jgi:ABC-type sugar transport system permease subunit
MQIVVPVTLLIIFLLLYLNFRRLRETLIVMMSLPFSLVGGLWFVWYLGFNLSVAVVVGFIALAGVAAETGVIMLIYLDHAWSAIRERCAAEGRPPTRADLYEAIMIGAVERVRPKMMTVIAIMAGLLPILWATGTGSEVMRRIAVPMIGGMVSSTVLTLLLGYPMAYAIARAAPSIRPLLLMAVILPFWTSFLIRVYAWMGLLSENGILNQFLGWSGLAADPGTILGTEWAIYLGIVYAYLPFMVLPIYASLVKADAAQVVHKEIHKQQKPDLEFQVS